MSYNTGNKTVIDGFDALSEFEDTEHLERAYRETNRIYRITEATNGRVVILLRDYKKIIKERYTPQSRNSPSYPYSIRINGAKIIAPKGAQVTIIGGERMSIDCPENDVRFYKSGDVVTRHNTGKVHAKDCKDVTAHQNHLVMVNGNEGVYAKWNKRVIARNNGKLSVFFNDNVDETGSSRINPGELGYPEIDDSNNYPGASGDNASI